MAHEIEIVDGVARMFYAGEVPWHGLGTRVEHALTSEEAIVAAGLDWEVELRPLYSGRTLRTAKRVDRFLAISRTSDNKVLGVATERYTPLQNKEAFTFTDSLVKDGVMRYVTAGSLMGGRKVWLLGQMEGDWRINGEQYCQYILLTAGHDASTVVDILPTNERVVCHNTLQWALAAGPAAAREFRIIHNPALPTKLEAARKALEITTEAFRNLQELLEVAQQHTLEAEQVKVVTEGLFGSLDEATKGQRAKAIETFQAIYAAESALNGETAYAMVNAIAGYADHSKRYHGDSEQRAESRLLSTIVSTGGAYRFKAKGIDLVKKVAQIS